jgi:hypothetical protein
MQAHFEDGSMGRERKMATYLDDNTRKERVKRLLLDVKLELIARNKNPQMTDTELAEEFGVGPASLSHWFNKTRLPNYWSTIKLSKHPLIGARIFEIVGFESPGEAAKDPQSYYVQQSWFLLSKSEQDAIYNRVKKFMEGIEHGNETGTNGGGDTS